MELSFRHVTRSFGALRVLEDVTLTIPGGRVVALVGENGAGKSTLIRAACGLVAPDAGEVTLDGAPLPPGDSHAAIAAGVGVVHQHFMLVPVLSVADNVALGAEPRTGPLGLWVDRAAVTQRVRELSERHGLPIDTQARVEALSVGERQRVEILKVLYRGARVLLFDEPTAVLSPGEVSGLLETLRALAAAGAGVLFVSHKLDEVFAVADDIVVLRRGRVVLAKPRASLTRTEVAEAVMGDHRGGGDAAPVKPGTGEALALDDVTAEGFGPVSLRVAPGEVLGVAGVEGNGQRALAALVAGIIPLRGGRVRVAGDDASAHSVAARRAAGVGYVPEDRETTGLVAELSLAENVLLGDPDVAARSGAFDRTRAEREARAVIARFNVRPPDPWAVVRTLSGGNQQKVLLGRELARTLKVLVVAQPTRGVDLGASADIHVAIREAASRGVAVLLISSELDELRSLAQRVVVLRGGRIAGELPVADATDARLGALMIGGGS